MSKIFKKIMPVVLSFFCIISIVSCKDDTNKNENNLTVNNGTTENKNPNQNSSNSNNSTIPLEEQKFLLTVNIEGATLDGTTISIDVPYTTYTYSFINAFTIPSNYKWELHWDKECLPNLNLVSKNVNLDTGDNNLYALFVNKTNFDEIYLYEIQIYREYRLPVGAYIGLLGDALHIYEDGTFLYDNGSEIRGNWTLLNDTIIYSFWGDTEYESVFDKGISFRGVYYELIKNNS